MGRYYFKDDFNMANYLIRKTSYLLFYISKYFKTTEKNDAFKMVPRNLDLKPETKLRKPYC